MGVDDGEPAAYHDRGERRPEVVVDDGPLWPRYAAGQVVAQLPPTDVVVEVHGPEPATLQHQAVGKGHADALDHRAGSVDRVDPDQLARRGSHEKGAPGGGGRDVVEPELPRLAGRVPAQRQGARRSG